jgi:hypothetical protein
MLHLAAFYQSVDPAGAYVQLAAPADDALTVNTPRIQVPPLNQVVMLAAGLESVVAPLARIVAPSLLTLSRNQIRPVSTAVAGPVLVLAPHRLMDLRDDPIMLVPSEQLTLEINTNPAAVQIQWGLVLFSDMKPTPLNGRVFTARATVANALVAGSWTLNTLTFDDQLPRGRYQIAGLRGESTTIIACRLVVPSQAYRPGVMGTILPSDLGHDMFRFGNLGTMGEFEDVDNLQIQTLSSAADAAAVQSYFVDLIQLRLGPG